MEHHRLERQGEKRPIIPLPSPGPTHLLERLTARSAISDIGGRNHAKETLQKSEEQAKQLAQENSIMAEIGRIISSTLNIEDVYKSFAEKVRKLIQFDRIAIGLINVDEKTMSFPYTEGLFIPGREPGDVGPLIGSTAEKMLQTHAGMIIAMECEEEIAARVPALLPDFRCGIRSALTVPLISGDRVIGTLALRSIIPGIYTERDLKLVESIGNQIAGAITNAQLFNERKRTEEALRSREEEANRLARENEIVAEIGQIISSTLNIDEVYALFSEKVKILLPYDRIAINLIDRDGVTLINRYVEGDPAPQRNAGDVFSIAGTLTEMMIQDREGLITDSQNEEEMAAKYPGLLPEFKAGCRSFLSVPLISGDKLIGGLHLRSRKFRFYSEKDLKLAESIAHQIAGAIANAQLFAERKQAEEKLRQSEENARQLAQENAIMAEIGRIVSSTLNISEVYERFAEQVQKLISFDRLNVNLINYEARTATSAYSSGKGVKGRLIGDVFPLEGTATGEVSRTHSGLLLHPEDQAELERRLPGLIPSFQAGHRSMMVVPLISKGNVIASLYFCSTKSKLFNDRDLRLAELIGAQIAGAIANAQLFAERKQAEEKLRQSEENARQLAQENAIVAEIGRIISSNLDIDKVYESFFQEVKKIIPIDRIVIDIIDTEKGTAKNVYMAGGKIRDRNGKAIYSLEGTGNAEMVRTKSTLLIQTEDFDEYKDRFPRLLSTFQAGFRSIMNVPLFSKGKIIGGLLIRSRKPYAYTDKDVRIAERIGSQIAGAIANAQLYVERLQSEKERVVLEEQLHQAQRMEAIGTLAGGIAHDFNNILSAILGYVELASFDLEEGSEVKDNLKESMKAAHRAKDLVQQILAFSRQEKQERKPLNTKPIVEEGLKFLRASLPATIEIHQQTEEDLGAIDADPTQVHQVLMNLCTNAAHAMDEKGGVLEVSLRNLDLDRENSASAGIEPGPYVRLRVSDTGHGMPPEILKRIFDPYFTTKEVGKGTGMGLAVVHGIVKSYGGGIAVSSEVGKGSTFDVYFPRIETAHAHLETHEVEPLLLGGHERVLLVDDEEAIAKVVRKILEHLGYEVATRTSSIEALELFRVRANQFDLVITDMTMPNMTGDKLAQELLRIRPGIPIILCTGFSEHITPAKAKAMGIRELVMKPIVIKDLAEAVRGTLDDRKIERDQPTDPRLGSRETTS